ncbi:MAG: Clp protease N-terminal domain-containing protein, partial [Cyanobacteria bacterium J06628_3]
KMILLGLIAEENGIAAKVLKSAGLTLDKTRVEVEKIIGRGSSFIEIQIPFTPRVKRVFEFALEQAHQFGTNHVDTEHLLLGLLLEGNGVAVRVLNVLRVDINHLRQKVIEEIASEKVQISAFKASTNENIFDFTSGAISARFCNFLSSWIESHELGYIVTNTGFRLSSGDLYAPHIAFYSKEKLKQIPRIYPELSPDLIVEIKTAFEQLNTIQTKISNFLEMGIGSAILINPDERTVSVSVYKSDNKHNVNLFHDGDKLTLPDLFPGWELEVSELWVN